MKPEIRIPESTIEPGWPTYLRDKYGVQYVRLRDGKTIQPGLGESCLYGLIDDEGYVDRAHQWIPNLGATRANMTLTGGTWSTGPQLIAAGQTPIQMPEEPIEV